MKESTKTEEVKIEVITKENLSNLSKGYFHFPISKGQTEKISSSLKMREYWGVPRPFGGEFGDDPFIEGFLYLWVRKSVTVLYLAKKFEPNMFQRLFGKHPKVQVWTCSISPSKRDFTLAQITDLLDQHP